MIFKSKRLILTSTLATLLAIGIMVAVAGAAEPLPERPIVPAVTTSPSPSGSKLILKAPTGSSSNGNVYDADDWTVVQWQAVNGSWYDVEGWQGHFFFDADSDPDNWQVEWWVGSENHRKKNFRFVIYINNSRERIKQTSAVFDLPETRGTAVEVNVGQ